MKHLILGSEGLIGKHLVRYLRNIGEDVIEFDIRHSKDEDLRYHGNRLLFENALRYCDFVFFLAYDVGNAEYMQSHQDTNEFISNNIRIMDTVFSGLKHFNKQFIFSSSQISRNHQSTYGLLKAIGERYTKSLNGITARFWNVYGLEDNQGKSRVISDFIEMAKTEGKITMKTTGKEERQFLYGDDCAECLYILSKEYDKIDRNKPVDVTSFKWTKIIDVASMVSAEFGNCPVISGTQEDRFQKNIRNEPDSYILRFWQPKTSLEQGIKRIIHESN